jgi:hypothetical protein
MEHPFPSISGVRPGCAPLIRMGPVSRPSVPPRVRIVGSEWTKTEAADEAAATTVARVKCMTRCARTVAKPRRSRLNRTRRGPSIAAIVSQSAGRDGSSQERQQSVRTLFRSSSTRSCGWRGAPVFHSHPIRGSTRRRRPPHPRSGPPIPDVGFSSGEASRPRPTRADT